MARRGGGRSKERKWLLCCPFYLTYAPGSATRMNTGIYCALVVKQTENSLSGELGVECSMDFKCNMRGLFVK